MRHMIKISELAAKQYGTISREQLVAVGEDSNAIDRAIESGLLVRQHAGAYLLAGARPCRESRYWAALHFAGGGAVLSHLSAAWHWRLEGLGKQIPAVIDVSVPWERRVRRQRTIRIHRTRSLVLTKDFATLAGIPVTSISRTLVDLCELLNAGDLEHAYDCVVRRYPQNRNAVIEALFRLRLGRPHLDKLATIANRKEHGCTQSWLENETRQVLRAANIPLPRPQHPLHDKYGRLIGIFDFAWPETRVVLAVDSWEFHKDRDVWEKDHRQQGQLSAIRWLRIPVTYRRLMFERAAFLSDLRDTLGLPVETDPHPRGQVSPANP